MAIHRKGRLLEILLITLCLGCSDDNEIGPFFDTAVWTIGANEGGVLGDGTVADKELSYQVESIQNPVRLEASSVSSMALTSDGKLFVWGDNSLGQLGISADQKMSLVPIQILQGHFVRAMTTGGSVSAAITVDGILWMWGTMLVNVIKGEAFIAEEPLAIKGLPRMTNIVCGINHCLAISENGEVWSWGNNLNGQLGDGSQSGSIVFRKVANLPFVVQVAVGRDHSVALAENGEVFVWGSNEFGQLGINDKHFIPEMFADGEIKRVLEPTKVPWLEDIINVKAGNYHNLVLRKDGELMAWGRGGSGQLGSSSFDNLWRPRKVTGISNAVLIYASSEGSCAIRNTGEFYSWGMYNVKTNELNGVRRSSPTRIPCLSGAVGVARGNSHYMIVKSKAALIDSVCFIY